MKKCPPPASPVEVQDCGTEVCAATAAAKAIACSSTEIQLRLESNGNGMTSVEHGANGKWPIDSRQKGPPLDVQKGGLAMRTLLLAAVTLRVAGVVSTGAAAQNNL
jgi:hypothetical protein